MMLPRALRQLIPVIALFLSAPSLSAQDLYDETVVRDIELTFTQANWWNDLYTAYQNETYITADMVVEGVTYPSVGVRFKGNSSASVWPADKMPFKIKTDEFTVDQKLMGYDTLNFGNSFMDPSFTREVLTYHVLRQYGPAPKANYVRLWLNGTYWGIYSNVEQVSGEFLDEWFEDDTGNRYKCDPVAHAPGIPPSTLTWAGSNIVSYQQSYELKSDPTGTEWQDLVDMIDVLNNRPASVHWDELAPLLNMDRALWFLAGQNLFVNLDSYIDSGHNYYVYNDPHEGRFSTIPWDTNEAFGNFGMGRTPAQLQQHSPLANYGHPDYPLLSNLLDPAAGMRGRGAYYAHMRDMFEGHWDWTTIGGLVQQYHTLIETDVANDTKKLYTTQDFYDNVTQDVQIGSRTALGLQTFVNNRRSYLLGLSEFSLPRPTVNDARITPTMPSSADDVTVLAELSVSGASLDQASVFYRTGPATLYTELTMFDDGQHDDGVAGDGTYGAFIPAQSLGTAVDWFIMAWTTADISSFSPIAGEESPYSYYVAPPVVANGLVVNEFVAKNNSGIQDEAGQFEDWLEIYNGSGSTIDLSGAYLSDDSTDLTQWQIPAGTILAAGDTLLVWADDDELDGPMHATFKLSTAGEEILLVDADGVTLRDHVVFGAQGSDISTGRLFDGDEQFVTFSEPTPEASNEQTCGYRSFDQLDPVAHGLLLAGSGTPSIGGSIALAASGADAGDSVSLYVSTAPSYRELLSSAGVVLIDPTQMVVSKTVTANASGIAGLSVPLVNPGLAGRVFYVQAYLPSSSLGKQLSNGVELIICP